MRKYDLEEIIDPDSCEIYSDSFVRNLGNGKILVRRRDKNGESKGLVVRNAPTYNDWLKNRQEKYEARKGDQIKVKCGHKTCTGYFYKYKDENKKYCNEKCRRREEKRRYYEKRAALAVEYLHLKSLTPLEDNLLKSKRVSLLEEPGFYFLWLNDVLQYIGSTQDLRVRVWQWRCKKPSNPDYIPFNKSEYIKYSGADILEIEAKFIARFKPPYNTRITINYKKKVTNSYFEKKLSRKIA